MNQNKLFGAVLTTTGAFALALTLTLGVTGAAAATSAVGEPMLITQVSGSGGILAGN